MIIYLVFSEFTSKSMSLIAFTKISVFSLIVCKFSPNILMSGAKGYWDFQISDLVKNPVGTDN